MQKEPAAIAAEWRAQADALARWTLDWLADPTDAWRLFSPRENRAGREPWKSARRGFLRRSALSAATLARHYESRGSDHLVAILGPGREGSSRWLAVRLASHSAHGVVCPETNLAAALRWHRELTELDLAPCLLETDDRGEYVILQLLSEPTPVRELDAMGRHLVRDWADAGLHEEPEILPAPGAERLLRLPGRHPVRDHWTRAWRWKRWLEGDEAVSALLGAQPSPGALVRAILEPRPRCAA